MPHKLCRVLSFFWATSFAIFALFMFAAETNAQEILQPYAPAIVSSQFDTAGSPATVSGTQPPVVSFWVTKIREGIVTTLPIDSSWSDEDPIVLLAHLLVY